MSRPPGGRRRPARGTEPRSRRVTPSPRLRGCPVAQPGVPAATRPPRRLRSRAGGRRRAGRTAGQTDAEVPDRHGREPSEEQSDRRAEKPSDECGDDALVADEPAHLLRGGPDGAQQAELARALVDREEQAVGDPEERDQAHREQRVEEEDDLVDATADLGAVLVRRPDLRRREARQGSAGAPANRDRIADALVEGGVEGEGIRRR